MKIAIISDVHGNYPALTAVIKDAIENNVEHYIFAGDYVFDLPYPNEVTELIRGLKNASVIQGNREGYLKKLLTEDQKNWNIDQMGAAYQAYRDLKPDNLSYLTNLSDSCFVSMPFHGRAYITHFIKDIYGELKKTGCSSSKFKKDMSKQQFTHKEFLASVETRYNENDISSVISYIDASVIIMGHNHLQYYCKCGDKLIINPGSCGQPLDFDTLAPYSILEDTAEGLNVEERRVSYDIEKTISYSKTSEMYNKGRIWSELVFLAMRTGADYFSDFIGLAKSIALEKNETGNFFSNETWNKTAEIFFEKH